MAIKKCGSDEFYAKISSFTQKRKFPLKAMFELTYHCNFRCIHCYVVQDKDKQELTTQQVRDILRQLKDAGCFHIGFTGGEPLLRKDIFEILDFAKRSGFRISLLTNGYLIDEKIAERIASLGTSLNRVDVSVLGGTKKTFERITRKKNSFNKVMRAIKLLKEKRVNVQIKTTLMKPNQDEFLLIKKLADKLGTLFRYGSTLNPKMDRNREPLRYQINPLDAFKSRQAISRKKKVIDEEIQEGRYIKGRGRKKLFNCGAGKSEVSISPYGEMNLCMSVSYPAYNILKGDFTQGWKNIKAVVENLNSLKDYACENCNLAQFCSWCPARGWLFSGDLTKCNTLDKDMALTQYELNKEGRI